MNELEKNDNKELDRMNYFSYTVKAGKRIYYLDVKKDRRNELYLSITESKKVYYGEGSELQVSFEKHKIFLYRNDFGKFIEGLTQAMKFVHNKEEKEHLQEQNSIEEKDESNLELDSSINNVNDDLDNLKIDF
ncbi:MAG TPA: DUF3276 family protein [Bacteroidaceae bacterium]|nr:DUF3276 family protein [Bacteroidaceae bacterium]